MLEALIVSWLLSGALPAVVPPPLSAPLGPQDAEQASGEDEELPPIEPPPPLTAVQDAKLERALKKLRNDNETYRVKAEAGVIEFGRGAIPALLDASHTDNEAMQQGLVNCLVALADLRDRDTVEECLESDRAVLRRFAVRKTGDYGLDDLHEKLVPRLEDQDEEVAFEAALALVRNGRDEGLPLAARAFQAGREGAVLEAVAGVKDKGTHRPLAELLTVDPKREKRDPEGAAQERLAAVRLLHAIGDEASERLLLTALDDKHNVVQREAIDALRHLLEGASPLEATSIFKQIEEVERLKQVAAQQR
jgi:HEAT repeat protein